MDHDMDRFRPDMSKFGHRPAMPDAPRPRAAPQPQAVPPPRSAQPGTPRQASPEPSRPRRKAKAPVLLAVMVMLGVGASMVFRQLDEADLAELRNAATAASQAESVRRQAADRVAEALAEAEKARVEAMTAARAAAAAARAAPRVEEAGDGDGQDDRNGRADEGRPDEVANRIVRRHSAAFRACYERALKTASPDLKGRVVLRVAVAPSGAVTHASIADDTLGDPPTADCIVRRARAMRFPAREDAVTLTLPLVFAAEN